MKYLISSNTELLIENPSAMSFKKSFLIYLLLGILALYVVFAPTVNIPFYHHDIYKYSEGGFHHSCKHNPGNGYMIALARPLQAKLDCMNYKIANTLEKMGYIRLFTLFLNSLAFAVLAAWLYTSRKIAFWIAFFIAGAIFYLPAMQSAMIMGTTIFPISILLALLSYYFMSRSSLSFNKPGHRNTLSDHLYLVPSFLCLIGSLLSYFTLSAFYLMPAMLLVLFKPLAEWKETRKIVIRDILFFTFCCVLFFIYAKNHMAHSSYFIPSSYRFNLNLEIINRLFGLYKIFPQFWNLYSGLTQFLIFNAVFIAGCSIALIKYKLSKYYIHNKKAAWSYLIQAVISFGVLLSLGAVTYLTVPSVADAPVTRLIFVFQAMGIVFLFWSIVQFSGLFKNDTKNWVKMALMLAVLFIGAIFANYNVTKSALNDYTEFTYITSSVAKGMAVKGNEVSRIHLIASSERNFNGLSSVDDIFNVNTTIYPGSIDFIVYAALAQFVNKQSVEIADCIFLDTKGNSYNNDEIKCIKSAPKNSIIVTYSVPGKPIYKSPHMLIVNMNALNYLTQEPKRNLN